MLSGLLYHAGIGAGSAPTHNALAPSRRTILTFDECAGLVTGAVCRRMSPTDRVVRVTIGAGVADRALRELDVDPSRVDTLPLELLLDFESAERRASFVGRTPELSDFRENADAYERAVAKHARRQSLINELQSEGGGVFDSFVCGLGASCPDQVLMGIIPLMADRWVRPGGTLAIAGPHDEPLKQLQKRLRVSFFDTLDRAAKGPSPEDENPDTSVTVEDGETKLSSCWTHVKLHEYFTREHQVLPNRTHPLMASSLHLSQNFLLAATRVAMDLDADRKDLESRIRCREAEGQVYARLGKRVPDQSCGGGKGKRRKMGGRR